MKIIDNMIGDDAQMREMLAEASLNAEVGQLIYDARHKKAGGRGQRAELTRVDFLHLSLKSRQGRQGGQGDKGAKADYFV